MENQEPPKALFIADDCSGCGTPEAEQWKQLAEKWKNKILIGAPVEIDKKPRDKKGNNMNSMGGSGTNTSPPPSNDFVLGGYNISEYVVPDEKGYKIIWVRDGMLDRYEKDGTSYPLFHCNVETIASQLNQAREKIKRVFLEFYNMRGVTA